MRRRRGSAEDRGDFAAQALACADALHNLARYLARDASVAEDLVQETYVRAFAAADQLEAGANLKAWLFRILRNAFLSNVRRAGRDPTEPGLDTVAPAAEPPPAAALRDDPELEAMRRIVSEEIEEALRSLGEEARTVVLLDLEGFSEAELASILGCPQGTVKSRLSRARAALRERLADYARGARS
jgi:RNA polymerase sigma-70 factor (ECF subfamily)